MSQIGVAFFPALFFSIKYWARHLRAVSWTKSTTQYIHITHKRRATSSPLEINMQVWSMQLPRKCRTPPPPPPTTTAPHILEGNPCLTFYAPIAEVCNSERVKQIVETTEHDFLKSSIQGSPQKGGGIEVRYSYSNYSYQKSTHFTITCLHSSLH